MTHKQKAYILSLDYYGLEAIACTTTAPIYHHTFQAQTTATWCKNAIHRGHVSSARAYATQSAHQAILALR